MDKVRIHEIAKELGLKNKDVIDKAKEMGLNVKVATSSVTEENAQKLAEFLVSGTNPVEPKKVPEKRVVAKKSAPAKEADKPKEEAPKTKPEPLKKESTAPKSSEAKEQKRESLSNVTGLRKKRGLVIVKKRRKVEPKAEESLPSRKPIAKELPQKDESVKVVKKKKVKTPALNNRKDSGKKLELLNNRDLKDVSLDLMDDEVVLPDFSEAFSRTDEEKKQEPQQRKRKKSASQQYTQDNQRNISRSKRKKRRPRAPQDKDQSFDSSAVVEIPEDIRVYEFADTINRNVGEIIKVLFSLGMMVTKNDFLDKDTLDILAEEFSLTLQTYNPLEKLDYTKEYEEEQLDNEELVSRAPVITIMGHVDHGKTSLLDRIRLTKVADKEAGGITQHIGAYQVVKNEQKITFIDTPGHSAFTEMRARGAQSTDIAIIVVAADDGVKPQTVEAIDHAKAAEVPIIIAINKIDKPDANPDLAKSQLSEIGIMPIDWGGAYEFVEVSAKTGVGIDDLLETILLQSEVMELTANENMRARAVVIESSLEKGRGPVATVIIQNGTLRIGDSIVCGTSFGKVRAVVDDEGKSRKELFPSDPIQIIGLNKVPPAGEILVSVNSDKEARDLAQQREEFERQKELSKSTKATLDELSALVAEGEIKKLPVIVKADTQGTLEAIKGSFEKIQNEEVRVHVISGGVGAITESDVTLADASENSVILGFNVRPTGAVKDRAKQLGIDIKTYSILYELLDDIKALLGGLLSPIISEENIGQAEVRDTFSVPKIGVVAGCIVTDGLITRNANARVIRDGVIIYDTTIVSLKRFKDDAKEVGKGYECGIMLDNFNDVKVGDYIESYKKVETQATL